MDGGVEDISRSILFYFFMECYIFYFIVRQLFLRQDHWYIT